RRHALRVTTHDTLPVIHEQTGQPIVAAVVQYQNAVHTLGNLIGRLAAYLSRFLGTDRDQAELGSQQPFLLAYEIEVPIEMQDGDSRQQSTQCSQNQRQFVDFIIVRHQTAPSKNIGIVSVDTIEA